MNTTGTRDTFTTRWGFILAAAGSAVGLGNLWMFPWRLGEYGGAAFLVPYLLFVYVLGTTGLMGEFAFGLHPGIQRFTKNILFDEKIGGTAHMALGASSPETGGVNQSAIHWDMICDLRHGGEVYVDGTLFAKDGEVVI